MKKKKERKKNLPALSGTIPCTTVRLSQNTNIQADEMVQWVNMLAEAWWFETVTRAHMVQKNYHFLK